MEDRLIWIDVEPTGVNSNYDHLLQVACLVTTPDLEIVDATGYEATIEYDPNFVEYMKEASDRVVLDMHTRNGLWGECSKPTAKDIDLVDEELSEYIRGLSPEPKRSFMAGNSIRLDRNFIETDLPKVNDRLHYQSVDVTSLALTTRWWLGLPAMAKNREHTAMADIRESIKESRIIRDIFYI